MRISEISRENWNSLSNHWSKFIESWNYHQEWSIHFAVHECTDNSSSKLIWIWAIVESQKWVWSFGNLILFAFQLFMSNQCAEKTPTELQWISGPIPRIRRNMTQLIKNVFYAKHYLWNWHFIKSRKHSAEFLKILGNHFSVCFVDWDWPPSTNRKKRC